MNAKLAIIGASYLQLPLIETAKNMGLETHVFAWELGADGEKEADYFYPVSIREKEKILEICQDLGIDGICSIASDLAVITVDYVASHLGLNCNSINCSKISTNKHLMRQMFKKYNCPSPNSILISGDNEGLLDFHLTYPIIIKPTDRSGSRGIYRIDKKDVVIEKKAIETAIEESFENKALVEEYIEGEEYSVEYISYKGAHFFLQITKKYTTGSPHFIETGHLESSGGVVDSSLEKRIREVVERALDALEVENGASHTEIKVDKDGKVWLIESASRMGGDMIGSHLVKETTGFDFTKAVIDIALGKDPNLTSYNYNNSIGNNIYAGIKYIFDSTDEGRFRSTMNKYPDIIKFHHIDNAMGNRVRNSAERLGFYMVKFSDKELVEEVFG